MKAIKPLAITDAMLTSSNVSEDDYDEYAAGTTYGAGDSAIITTIGIHKVYESLKAANTGNYPPDNLIGDDPWWLEVSATNRWKMFDYIVQSQTENAYLIQITITPGEAINSIALLSLDAASISIVMNDPVAGNVYSEYIVLEASEVILWQSGTVWSVDEEWQGGSFDELVEKVALRIDLPSYPNASITVTISSSGATAKCGVFIIGTYKDLGETKYSPSFGIIDYSIKEADDFGNYTVLERAFSKKVSASFFMGTSEHESVLRFLTHYRATALLWILSEDFNTTLAYGFYKNFTMTIPYITMTEAEIDIEGLT
jgi:hypothetical protein